MLNKIVGIKLKGSKFDEETNLNFFLSANKNESTNKNKDKNNLESKKVCLLYGRNGSGKSTIAKSIRKILDNSIDNIDIAEFINDHNGIIQVDDNFKSNIYVFDEKYIDDNIKFKEDGLDTIVMLGKEVNLDKKIEEIEKIRGEIDIKINTLKNKLNEFENTKSFDSPEYYKELIKKEGLKEWYERSREIEQDSINKRITKQIFKKIIDNNVDQDLDTLKKKYKEKIELYLKIAKNKDMKNISHDIKYDYNFQEYKNNIESIQKLLSKSIEKPELTNRDKELMELITTQQLKQIKDVFLKNNMCQYCLQEISDKYREETIQRIENMLSDKLEKYCEQLNNVKLSIMSDNFNEFYIVDETLTKEYEQLIKDINEKINKVNGEIDNKLNDTYKYELNYLLFDEILNNLEKLFSKLNHVGYDLNNKKNILNENIKNISKLKKELEKINIDLSYCENKPYIEIYNKKIQAMEDIKKTLQKFINESDGYKKNIERLIAQKKNVKIATNIINEDLKGIFFSKDRLLVECKDSQYILTSKNKSIKPRNISTGERNIIALSYFFTQIFENKDEGKISEKEYLLIIDDPISSFDNENVIGVVTYLRDKLKKFSENYNSKILLMTHDLRTYTNLKILLKSDYTNYVELVESNIKSFNKKHDYKELLNMVYNYALNENSEDNLDLIIGNVMRRVLEAFNTFSYNLGIDIFNNNEILEQLKKSDENFGNYFSKFICKILLNEESHFQDKIKNNDIYIAYETEEKRKFAKDVMCYIYLLNPLHISRYLIGKKNYKENIEKWCDDIKELYKKEQLELV